MEINYGDQMKYVSTREAANILGTSIKTIGEQCREGVLECERFTPTIWKVSLRSIERHKKKPRTKWNKAHREIDT